MGQGRFSYFFAGILISLSKLQFLERDIFEEKYRENDVKAKTSFCVD